jgi:uncharacterized protein (TIGR03435 family)
MAAPPSGVASAYTEAVRFLLCLAIASVAAAQSPTFEVASVKPSEPITREMVAAGNLNIGVSIDATHVRMSKMSLADLFRLAYQIKPYQYAGPPWMMQSRYDIQASLPEGAKRAQVPAMLQALLADRFKLVFHRETREMNVYALVAGKDGPKLKATAPDAKVTDSGQLRGGATVTGNATVSMSPAGDSRTTPLPGGGAHVETAHMTLPILAELLTRYVGRPVLDFTGIAGNYDMEFDVARAEMPNAAHTPAGDTPSDPEGVSVFTSILKLGLKLEARKAPVEVLVVDRAERVPTEN